MGERVRPFSNGSDYVDWLAGNCDQCIVRSNGTIGDGCALEYALGVAYLTDGKIDRRAAALIGCDAGYLQPCTMRHHKNDQSATRADVLGKIDAALNAPPEESDG